MQKIMLIDDDLSLQKAVKCIVLEGGYLFCSANSGQCGLDVLAEEKPDLLLLDIMMPGMNGFDVCQAVRDSGCNIPIIFLSAKGDIVDKSIGFKLGGDDYVVKPFSNEELMLRVSAHLRRRQGDLIESEIAHQKDTYTVGDFEIRFGRYEVLVRGEFIDLTARQFEILALLAANPGQVFTRQEIYEHIWGNSSVIDENGITVFIRKIREKIEDNPSQPVYLLTVWRVGYKFLAQE